MMERCDNCGTRILFGGRRSRGGLFCSRECADFDDSGGFCMECIDETNNTSAGGTSTVNGIGTMLYGSGKRCPDCGSVQQTKFFTILYIPLIPLGTYRVLYVSPSQYLSRGVGKRRRRSRKRSRRDDDY